LAGPGLCAADGNIYEYRADRGDMDTPFAIPCVCCGVAVSPMRQRRETDGDAARRGGRRPVGPGGRLPRTLVTH
jgi:hypothetical protein